ncbi:uncharacterized protein EI90DRAFT_2205127 [Cantharellus anzutake]|uniref:uncharacterized protein n=1 Tax=Cantharellus anzutake TaxID=1750568 RepID=UPI00190394D6|nr:uncharacterized protein EI90DRAFT_2205127 [Cantharellus anzutake]KAF8325005.1 hypothetical protein EI90DRAFT_2205127 [Cantharellus anzutake]
MSMFVEASGATTDDAIIAATSPRPQLVPLTGAIAAIANASGDRPDSPEGTVAGASKSALVFSPLVDFPTPLFAGDVYASGPVLPPGFIVEDSEPLSTYDLFQQHLSSSSEPDNEETCIQKQLSGEGIQLGDVVDSSVDDHHAVGESLIGDIYLPRSQLSDGVSSPGADELNEQRDFVHGSAVVPAPDLHQLGNLGGEIKRAGEPPSFLNADRFLSPADVLVPPNNPVPLTSPHLYHADIGSGDSNVVVQINQTRQPSAAPAADMETHAQLDTEIPNPNGNKDVCASDGHHDLADTPPAPPTLPDPFIPPTQLSIPDIEDTHLLRVPEHDAPEGSVVDSVTAEPPSTCGESPDTKFSEDIGRRHDNPPDSHGMKTEQRDGTRATNETDATAVHASVGTSGAQEIKGSGHAVPVRLSSKGNVPIADKNTFEVEAGPTQDDLTPDAADDNIKLSHANEGKLTLLVTNGETREELGKRDLRCFMQLKLVF